MNTIHEEINGGKSRGEERSPPPVIILGAKMKVGQENGRLRTRHDQNDKDEEEEAEHVIGLMRPDAVQDEEELDEDAAERQNSTHDDAGNRTRVDGLFGDLTRNLIRPNRMFDRALLEAEVSAHERQGHRHADPQS